MDEGAAYIPIVSSHLSQVMNEIGLNELTVRRRQQTSLLMETMESTIYTLLVTDVTVYNFGSQSEGTTTPGLHSDNDILICVCYINLIQDWSEWESGKINLLMLQEENTAPGYCRLQVLRSDIPLPVEDLSNEDYVHDRYNRVLMPNTWIHDLMAGRYQERNGPAQSNTYRPGRIDDDIVFAFMCKSWPRQADHWARQHRHGHWPTQSIINHAVENGTFLVPVGHRQSPTESLEWRISPSLAERCLMFDMNIAQIKCYVLLKMVMKTFVVPYLGKCISSFHCKTAMFHCIESTSFDIWRENNLLQCVTKCLTTLVTWLNNGHCPNYIIPEENLFAGKFDLQMRDRLLVILNELIRSNGRFLLRILIDDLGQGLQYKLSNLLVNVPVIDSPQTIAVIGILEFSESRFFFDNYTALLTMFTMTDSQTVISAVYQMISSLNRGNEKSNIIQQRVNRIFIAFLSSWLGSLIAACSLRQKRGIPREAIRWFRTGSKSDVSSRLKLASVYYCSGDLLRTEVLLRGVDECYRKNNLLAVCSCFDNLKKPTEKPTEDWCVQTFTSGSNKWDKFIAHCLIFTPQEVHCAPPALRHEMFRSVGDDVIHRGENDKWMDLIVVDSLPYLYYLQFMTYRKLGNQEFQERSLNNLSRCIREDQSLNHIETAWNLFGQCLELEQRPDAAINCYRASLGIRPVHNAAKWHISILCYRQIQKAKSS